MTLTSTSHSLSIFKDGKLKPGVYKIQNIASETYLDVEIRSRSLCCRPAKDLDEERGLWEIREFGAGYTVKRVEPGMPEQFCTTLEGIQERATLHVSEYPAAWRVAIVENDKHRGFGYVRFYWATCKVVWGLRGNSKDNGAPVQAYPEWLNDSGEMWKLIPVKTEGIFALRTSLDTAEPARPPPSYDRDEARFSTRAEHTESGQDELGTFVNEVSVVTTTVTTRKRYRVEDPS